ncbi:MAG: PorV/PorQ family protein [Elusimicrobia bacterium]|nr:PorV/PorQ family protein [Elusimicrobiota bacterium]
MRHEALAVLLALAALPAAAGGFGASQAGTSGGGFLKLGADARAAAMGGAVRAAVDDATAVYWNPAGLAGLRYRHATMTHGAAYQSTFQDFIAYAQPVDPPFSRTGGRERDLQAGQLGAIGVAILYHNSGALSEIDNTATPTGGRVTPQDLSASIAWGGTLARGLDVGIGLKYVSSQIQGRAETGAVDLGVRWRTWLPGDFPYAASLSAQNIGGRLKFHEQGDPLPLIVTLGQALKVAKSLVATLDLNAPRDRSPYPSFGLEWRVPMQQGPTAALRTGYDGRLDVGDSGGVTGLSLGAGLGLRRFGFDYGWSPAGGLGSTHKISLSCRF